jgi:hypothetical protein
MATVGKGRSVAAQEYALPGPLAVSAITGEYYLFVNSCLDLSIASRKYSSISYVSCFVFSFLQFHEKTRHLDKPVLSVSCYASLQPSFLPRTLEPLFFKCDLSTLITNGRQAGLDFYGVVPPQFFVHHSSQEFGRESLL